MKLIDSTAQTNWKFIAIIAVVALFAGGAVLFWQMQEEAATEPGVEEAETGVSGESQEESPLPPTEEEPPAGPEEVSTNEGGPAIRLISPNGGETWTIGEEATIRWEVQNAPPDSYVLVSISSENAIGGTTPVLKDVPSGEGMGVIEVPISNCGVGGGDTCGNLQPSDDYVATISLYTGTLSLCAHCPMPSGSPLVTHASDTSDVTFRVQAGPPTIAWVSPRWGNAGTKVTISGWGFSKTGNKVLFDKQELATVDSPDGTTLTFRVPDGIASRYYNVLVLNANGVKSVGHGNRYFTITEGVVEQAITISYPNGGETLVVGQGYNITWRSNDEINKVIISLYEGFGKRTSWIDTVNAKLDTYTWIVPSDLELGSYYFIRIDNIGGAYFDDSDGYFSIVGGP